MLNVQQFLGAFLAFAAVRGSLAEDFHATRPKEIPSTGERQTQSLQCPSNATESDERNYGCILYWRYYPYPGSSSGFTQKLPDYSACENKGQCLNGKCFQTNCVDSCIVLATQAGKTLTNIKVFNSANLVYCEAYSQVINNGGFSSGSQCELPGQTDFYEARDDSGGGNNNNSLSALDYLLPIIIDPNIVCGKSSNVQRNNGCSFRCFFGAQIAATRYIQLDGTKCGNNYSCLTSKCQMNSCINTCNSTANGGVLLDIIQVDDKRDKAYCLFQGQFAYNDVKLDSPSKCEANYPDDEDTNGGGSSETGSKTTSYNTKNHRSGIYNAGGNNYYNNSNSSANQGIVKTNEHNPNQIIGK